MVLWFKGVPGLWDIMHLILSLFFLNQPHKKKSFSLNFLIFIGKDFRITRGDQERFPGILNLISFQEFRQEYRLVTTNRVSLGPGR